MAKSVVNHRRSGNGRERNKVEKSSEGRASKPNKNPGYPDKS